ncbi:hypothetical protein GQ600_5892 [Phytophthora cactorum]|nr:hypothetical protein GQ600_5892 [Phytophthora cactorum]
MDLESDDKKSEFDLDDQGKTPEKRENLPKLWRHYALSKVERKGITPESLKNHAKFKDLSKNEGEYLSILQNVLGDLSTSKECGDLMDLCKLPEGDACGVERSDIGSQT